MGTFIAEYLDHDGKRCREPVHAPDRTQALGALRGKASVIITLKASGAASAWLDSLRLRARKRALSSADLQSLAHTLGAYLRAGISIQEALRLTGEANPRLGRAVQDVRTRLASGEAIEEALRASSAGFPAAFIASVRAGAESGKLPHVLENEARRLLALQEIRRDLVSSLIYPLALVAMCFLVIGFMLAFIVPQIRASLSDEAMDRVSGVAGVIFAASDLMTPIPPFWGLVAALVLFWLGTAAYQASEDWRNRMLLRAPGVGAALRSLNAASFCHAFGTMLEASVRAEKAWQLAALAVGMPYVRQRLEQVGTRILHGSALSTAASDAGVFPPDVIAVFALGERTGTLPSLLMETAAFHSGEALSRLRKLSGIVAPVIILLAGVIVGVFAVAMMSTILSVNQVYAG